MEAQPIALALLIVSEIGFGQQAKWALGPGTTILLLLGLQWWVMFTEQFAPRIPLAIGKPYLRLLGPCIAITIMAAFTDLPSLIPISILILLFWQLGIFQSQRALRDERLISIFRLGFIVMIVLTFFAFVPDTTTLPLVTLTSVLPLFFLSGLLALSFTRLSSINRENTRQAGVRPTRSTRRWFVFLTTTWGVLVAASVLLEFFAFQFVQYVLQPIWNLLGFLVLEILYLFSLLFYLLTKLFGIPQLSPPSGVHHQPTPPSSLSSQHTTHDTPSPLLMLILRLLLIFIIVIALILVVRMILHNWPRAAYRDEDEEIRETLSLQEILQERRQEQQSIQHSVIPETVNTASARARYRAFLQTVAWSDTRLARRTHETPDEYHARLAPILKQQAQMFDEAQHDSIQLEALTQAYTQERYGEKRTSLPPSEAFQAWLQWIQKRLQDS